MLKNVVLNAAALASACVFSLPATANTACLPEWDPGRFQDAIALQATDNATGVVARASEPGRAWQSPSRDTRFRVGSISKAFVAAVVLQLAADPRYRLDLDQTVQHYLPGLVPKRFLPITVRQLLNHTSGLPNLGEGEPPENVDDDIAGRFERHSLDELIRRALCSKHQPGRHFDPGAKQEYVKTNYLLAAKLVERLTGRPYADVVAERILRPLHLTGTSAPDGATTMPEPYLHAFLRDSTGALVDVSEQAEEPTGLVSTPADLDRFLTALFEGRLVPEPQLAEMFTLPKVAEGPVTYSAGLMVLRLADGTEVWGKSGHTLGYADGVFAVPSRPHGGIPRRLGVYSVAQTVIDNESVPGPGLRLAAAALGPFARPAPGKGSLPAGR